MTQLELWDRYRAGLFCDPATGVRLDVSRMDLTSATETDLAEPFRQAFSAMHALEQGAIANPDEGRRVGHYWLRDPDLAPAPEIARAIVDTRERIERFARGIHSGERRPPTAARFTDLLLVGIGGSALGPQFVAAALGGREDRLRPHFCDNTDPDGIDRILADLRPATTLTIVVSKSGGTPETRNGMLEAQAAYEASGLDFGPHAVAVTQTGSQLARYAEERRFVETFPMWDWVGGRTSVTSAVGLLPAALQGIDIVELLAGAAAMDRSTRVPVVRRNPAALLALAWHHAGGGRGARDMVVLPYKDRLALFSRYLQQLVMESLGKERDVEGRVVHQGLAVYGNKGSTDQHAYVQQLRDGLPNFFVTFIQVLLDRDGPSVEVEPGATAGDYLHGFYLGTRRALHENGRPSLTVTLPDLRPQSVGALIALYERAVGLYASLIRVNAYDQPGVEAGKKAAAGVLALQAEVLRALRARGRKGGTCRELARAAGLEEETETVFHVLEHLAAQPDRGVDREPGSTHFDALYRLREEG